MKWEVRLASFATLVMFIHTVGFADILYLKNGQEIEGEVVLRTDEVITVEVGEGRTVAYLADEIDRIDEGDSTIGSMVEPTAATELSEHDKSVGEIMADGITTEEALLKAAAGGDVATARTLLDSGGNVNLTGPLEFTLLHAAARMGHTEVVELLLDRGADVHAKTFWGGKPLTLAVIAGHADVVEALIAGGADVHGPVDDVKGLTALHYAATKGRMDVMAILVSHGADVNAKSKSGPKGGTPVMEAAFSVQPEALQFLIDHGADVNATAEGKTALMLVREWLKEEMAAKVIPILLEAGATE